MTCKKVLVYGWYNQGNIGDQLFIESFNNLFPDIDFTFTDVLTVENVSKVSTVIFGGGSLLLDPPKTEGDVLSLLEKKKLFYIGVGVESVIHPVHEKLIKESKLVAIRNSSQLERVRNINSNTILIPDLVHSLQSKIKTSKKNNKSVLVLPNIAVVPRHVDPQWKHAAWAYFKSEFCQFLDSLIEQDYKISFLSMCSNRSMSDNWASSEIVSHMKYRNENYLLGYSPKDFSEISAIFAQYDTVITQRFHGIVLSEMSETPHLVIHHHDKLKSNKENYLSYYGITRHALAQQFNNIQSRNCSSIMPIETNIFDELKCLFRSLQNEE